MGSRGVDGAAARLVVTSDCHSTIAAIPTMIDSNATGGAAGVPCVRIAVTSVAWA